MNRSDIMEKLSELRCRHSYQLHNEWTYPIVLVPYRYAGNLSDLTRMMPLPEERPLIRLSLEENLQKMTMCGFRLIMAGVEELTMVLGVEE